MSEAREDPSHGPSGSHRRLRTPLLRPKSHLRLKLQVSSSAQKQGVRGYKAAFRVTAHSWVSSRLGCQLSHQE